MRYRLIAIDLDGTLLDPGGEVSARNASAVRAARAAGARVVACTGRGLSECAHVLRAIGQTDPVVVAGGSIIADPVSARTLHRFAIPAPTVERVALRLVEHGHPALILKDPAEAGYDYLVVRGGERGRHDLPLDPVTRWWFEKLRVRVRHAAHTGEDEHPEHTVRVGACAMSGRLARIRGDLMEAAGPDAHVHHFPAVVGPEHAAMFPPGESLHVLELFDSAATKWSAVSRLARQWGVETHQIAAIGDEINDVSMIRGACQGGGLGVAMGNAVPAVREAASRQTGSNAQDGVAAAVERMLASEW